MSIFLPTSRFKRVDYRDLDSNKYCNNSLTGCVLEAEFEYPENLRKLHNNYPLLLDKNKIKRKMLSKYQLMIFFNNISIGRVKKIGA